MGFDFTSDFFSQPGGLSDSWDAALNFGGSDGSFITPRSSATVPTNALQSMAPVTAANDGGGWSDFWKGALQTAIGYSIQKDAVQSGVVRPPVGTQQAAQAQVVAQRGVLGNPLVLGLIGVGIFLAVRK